MAWLSRGDRTLLAALPEDEPDRGRAGRALAQALVAIAMRAPDGQRGMLLTEINGAPANDDPVASYLKEAGFAPTGLGLQLRVARPRGAARWTPRATIGAASTTGTGTDGAHDEQSLDDADEPV